MIHGGDDLIAYKLVQFDYADNVMENFVVFISPGYNPDGTGAPFELPFNNSGLTIEGTAYLMLLGRMPDIPGTYKLTIE